LEYHFTERTIVVLDSHFESIPIAPKPLGPASTFIKQLENRSSVPVTIFSTESNQTLVAAPGNTIPLNMAVPWALAQSDFTNKHLEVRLNGVTRFWLWQHDNRNDGDYVRVATNGAWSALGTRVNGFAGTGKCPADLVFTTDRSIIVSDNNLEVMPHPLLLEGLLDVAKNLIHPAKRIGEKAQDPVPLSEPKKSAVAFSMAGPVSDKFLRGEPGARFTYQESGKRYEFKIGADGKVTASHPDGSSTLLDKARSYKRLRKGESITPPAFDLIAANGGRVFAKAKDADDFYFASMDHLFIHAEYGKPDNAPESSIPSTYFKLDPEFAQLGQNPNDLLFTTNDIVLKDHPASERLPMFRSLLPRQLTDMMIARVEFREWQQLDLRPPQNILGLVIRDLTPQLVGLAMAVTAMAPAAGVLLTIAQAVYFLWFKETVTQTLLNLPNTFGAPPDGTPIYTPITYQREDGLTFNPPAISYRKVIDIGVGSVHHHQQYQNITGGEMQALLDVKEYADIYRFFNGPLQDGDGYCDGTINYYALVKHDSGYSLLYLDEQLYFSQRWRLVGPDDTKGAMFSLVGDLANQAKYEWNPNTYWTPFNAGHINDDTRLAVSAQVLLVTGKDPVTGDWRIYSINFSWGTMDRTWRWRKMPADKIEIFDKTIVAPGDEPIASNTIDTVYPQTIRLRDDMTINLKGSHDSKVGRWYQRYLPANNNLVPGRTQLVAGQMPQSGYQHKWKFLPEDVFRLADNFQFFGVYDQVDSRTQYYDVTPATADDAAKLQTMSSNTRPWIDDMHQLYVSQWKFNWGDARLLDAKPLDSPSLFNADTRLRIVKKGSRWIATHWDKRDDDMIPFERRPMQVTLKKRTPEGADVTVKVTIGEHHLVRQPPVVKNAYFWLEPNGTAGIAFESASFDPLRENIAKVRMASLEAVAGQPARLNRVKWFLDKDTAGNFGPIGPTLFEFRWTPSSTELPLLQQDATTANGALQAATSIWFEDVIGNVAPPEQILWQRSPTARGVATPSVIPLGVPTQVTVRASDFRTGVALTNGGVVKVDGQVVGTPDVPFTFTFNTHIEREFDPELHITIETVINPVITVSVPDYPEADVPVTFFTPKLVVRLEPASVPIGPTVQVVVRAEDATTHTPVQGRVIIGGVDVGATNTLFNFAFGPGNTTGFVNATGYPTKSFAIGLFTPEMQVSVSPSPIPTGRPVEVMVRAVDKRTGLPVNGRVKLNGVDTAATNTPFMFTFGLTAPAGVVSAPFNPDVAITWPPLSVSTMNTGITPMPIPINRTIQCTVSAANAQTGGLVSGRVRIDGADVGATNTPFSTIFRARRVGAEQELMLPEVTVLAFGYRNTLVDNGF
jgi:hypothetical protein